MLGCSAPSTRIALIPTASTSHSIFSASSHSPWRKKEPAKLCVVINVSGCLAHSTRFLTASTSRSIFSASSHFLWRERNRLPVALNVSGCSAPSTRFDTASTSLSLHLLRLIALSLAPEGCSQIVRGTQRVGMLSSEGGREATRFPPLGGKLP
jgi:hypothetical protein